MKKVIGKNQVIITSLAILIAVAGYLNFADVDLGFRDKEASTDSSSILEDAGYDLTDETALLDENQADGGLTDNSLTDSQETDTPGEAVFTGSTGFAAQAKISREQVRSQNKADLQDIINNEEIDDEEKQEDVYFAGMLHDIGKIGISNEIINKTGKLTDEEYEIIKTHPSIGGDILSNISEIPNIAIGARWHHERYDGKGYPDGLKGKDIPELARIIGVADAYDAMTSKRSYRDVLSQEIVRLEIEKGKGTQFDPVFAEIMLEMIDEDKNYDMHEK